MGLWTTIKGAVAAPFKSRSLGERRWTQMFPPFVQQPGNWTANRYELANHFRGWPYVAIDTICREIACLPPTFARVVPQQKARERVEKSLRTNTTPPAFMSRHAVKKSLIHIQGNDEIEPFPTDHPAVKLFRRPNPHDHYWTFAYKIAMSLKLHGVAYIWDVRDQIGRPCELWTLPPQWVREINGKDRLIDGYEVWPTAGLVSGDLGMGFFPGSISSGRAKFKYEEVIAIRYPSPISYTDGYSPLQAVGPWVDISNNIDRSRVQTFMNGAFPGVVIEVDPSLADLDEAGQARLESTILAKWQGVRNTKRPVYLQKGLTLKPFSTPANELEYTASAAGIRADLLAAYKVPQSIAGLVEQSTYSNADAAKLNFYRQTMKPEFSLWGQVFTYWSMMAYKDDAMLCYWADPTPEDPEFVLRRQEAHYRMGSTHPNEIREEGGKEPYRYGGNDPPLSMGTQFSNWNTGKQPELQPQQPGEEEPANPLAAIAGPQGEQQAEPATDSDTPDDFDIQKILAGGKNAAA